MASSGRGRGTGTKRGRHVDPLWQYVNKTADGKGFICMYCQKEFKGGLPKIRDHFLKSGSSSTSGAADSGNCAALPDEVVDTIKGLALPKRRKTALVSQALSGEGTVPHLLFNFILSTNLACKEIVSSPLHQLLSSVAKHGPSSLKSVENAADFENSRRAFEDHVKDCMEHVVNTWKSSGCTLIFYNFRERLVPALYSPAGLIFLDVKIQRKSPFFYSYREVKEALENHSPPVFLEEDVFAILYHDKPEYTDCWYQVSNLHDPFDGEDSVELNTESTDPGTHPMEIAIASLNPDLVSGTPVSAQSSDDPNVDLMDLDFFTAVDSDLAIDASLKYSCIRVLVNDFCRELINKNDLVRDVVQKSEKLYKFIALSGKCDLGIKLNRDYIGSVPPLNQISGLKSELNSWLLNLSSNARDELSVEHAYIFTLISDNDFWFNLRLLIKFLDPLFRMLDELDTFSPSIGYAGVLLSQAEAAIQAIKFRAPSLHPVFECFQNWKHTNRDLNSPLHLLANFLSPVSILNVLIWENEVNLDPSNMLLGELCSEHEHFSEAAVWEEVSRYASKQTNPFIAISGSVNISDHPVMLWRKHGKLFPLLQMAAEKVLSLPMCCMCHQIQNHCSKLQGLEDSEDYILENTCGK